MPVFDLVRMAWETRDVRGRRPCARNMHSALLHTSRLVIFGGFDGVQSLGDLHVLDTETMLWSQPMCGGKPPPCLQAYSWIPMGSRLLLFGGATIRLDRKGHTYAAFNDDTYSLDTQSMTWERLRKRGQQPAGRSATAIAAVGDVIVMLGGWSGKLENLRKLPTFNLDLLGSRTTVQVPGQIPAGLYGHTATVV